jgi:hypothetical protein
MSTMTKRERVMRTIRFEETDCVPVRDGVGRDNSYWGQECCLGFSMSNRSTSAMARRFSSAETKVIGSSPLFSSSWLSS